MSDDARNGHHRQPDDDLFGRGTLAPYAPPPGQDPPAEDPSAVGVTGIKILDAALDKAVQIPSQKIHEHVDRLRRRNPNASPQQIVTLLERQYLLAVSTSGGAVGAAAAVPAVGTGTGLVLTSSEVATFFAASAAFSLAVADVHGIAVEDTARRRTLLLATVLGEQGATTVTTSTGLATTGWARGLLMNMPTRTIKSVNGALARRFLRRQVAKQSGLALGRLIPFGIGAAIGVAGARTLGKTVIDGARRAFGPPPARFPREIEVVAMARDAVLPDLHRRPHGALGQGSEQAGGEQPPHPAAGPPPR